MAEKMTTMVLKVDLQCFRCYKKVKKILCKFPEIQDQVFDEKNNKVTIKVFSCCPERIRDKLFSKGQGVIKSIEILPPPPPPPKPNPPPPKPDPPPKPNPPPPKPDPPPPPKPQPEPPLAVWPPVQVWPPVVWPPCNECCEGRWCNRCFGHGASIRWCRWCGRPVCGSWGGGGGCGCGGCGWCCGGRCRWCYCEQNQSGCYIM